MRRISKVYLSMSWLACLRSRSGLIFVFILTSIRNFVYSIILDEAGYPLIMKTNNERLKQSDRTSGFGVLLFLFYITFAMGNPNV